jgi:hypothetical protein
MMFKISPEKISLSHKTMGGGAGESKIWTTDFLINFGVLNA